MKYNSFLGKPIIILVTLISALYPCKAKALNGWADLGAMLASSELGPISIVIGACASSAAIAFRPPPTDLLTAFKNSENHYDNYGETHNKVIADYFKANATYDLKKFYSFVDKNKAK